MIKKSLLFSCLIFLLTGCFLHYKSEIDQKDKDSCILYFINKKEVKTLLECEKLELITDFFWDIVSIKKDREKKSFKKEIIRRFDYVKKNYTKNNENPMSCLMAKYYILLGHPDREENYAYARKGREIIINWYYQEEEDPEEKKICFRKKTRDKKYKINKKKSSKDLLKKAKCNFDNYISSQGGLKANIKKNKKGIKVELKEFPFKNKISIHLSLLIIDTDNEVYRKDEIREININSQEKRLRRVFFYTQAIKNIQNIKTFYLFIHIPSSKQSILINKKIKI